MIRLSELQRIHDLLKQYLEEFPEHDQGDVRVYHAYELLSAIIREVERP